MNKKSKILIVEDEPIISSDIEMILLDNGYEVTSIEEDASGAMESIKKNKPDLVFIDINLEGDIDGVMLAQDINKLYNIPFIYLTSNTDKMTINRVKRTEPAGFIVKPFNEIDLKTNIEIALFSSKEKDSNTNKIVNDFFVKEGNSLIKVRTDKILFIKADDNYSLLFTTKKNYLLSQTLGKVASKLTSSNFIRIHRSFIVNTRYIDKIKEGYLYVGNHKLPLGRSYQENFLKKINKL